MTEASGEDGRAVQRETEQVVNEIAQGLRTLDDGTAWFSGLSLAVRQEVLREVGGYVMQAHITAADGCAGVARSGVKPTANPSVMICMDPPRYGFAKLPDDEHVKAFRVLVLRVRRRRYSTQGDGLQGHLRARMAPPANGSRGAIAAALSSAADYFSGGRVSP
ncbi:DUF5958 family protein [Streptomyces sp. DT9]